MAAGFWSANFIPGHDVANPLNNLEVAMWADPSFGFISICADAGLRCVFDTTFDSGLTYTEAHGIEIQFLCNIFTRLRTLWPVTSGH